MNRRETAQEPSMEEILASIRKIIADEPTRDPALEARPLPRLSFPPRETQSRNATTGNGAVPARLSSRLNDAFSSGSAPDFRPQAPIAQTAHDDGLDDLLADGPQPEPATDAPRRLAPNPTPARTFQPAQTTFQNGALTLKTEPPIAAVKPELQEVSPSPEPSKSEPIVIASMAPVAPVAPATWQIPPPRTIELNTMPTLAGTPDLTPLAAVSEAERTILKHEPAANKTAEHEASAKPDTSPPAVAAVLAVEMSALAFPAEPVASATTAVQMPLPGLTATGAQPQTMETAAAPAGTFEMPASALNGASATPNAPLADTAPPAPAWVPGPTAAAMAIGLDQTAHRSGELHDPPATDAVTSALEALAARLSASSGSTSPEIVVATVDVSTPTSTAQTGGPSSMPVSVFTSPDSFVGGVALRPMPTRTLDDTAAELLRPMLRHWLDENMPRIVEKALRIELAQPSSAPPESETKG